MIQPFRFTGESLIFVDQRKLPHVHEDYVATDHVGVAYAIKEMVVRGAPAIGTEGRVLGDGTRAVVSAAANAPCSALITPGILGGCGEVPVAAAYISEMARAKGRGPFFLLYETIFAVGLLLASISGAFLVPRYGWQIMFFIGAAPA